MVTVYSRPKCVQCDATYRMLDSKGVEYRVVDMSESPEALDKVKAMGFLQAPVIVTDSDSWSGFRPDKISGLA